MGKTLLFDGLKLRTKHSMDGLSVIKEHYLVHDKGLEIPLSYKQGLLSPYTVSLMEGEVNNAAEKAVNLSGELVNSFNKNTTSLGLINKFFTGSMDGEEQLNEFNTLDSIVKDFNFINSDIDINMINKLTQYSSEERFNLTNSYENIRNNFSTASNMFTNNLNEIRIKSSQIKYF